MLTKRSGTLIACCSLTRHLDCSLRLSGPSAHLPPIRPYSFTLAAARLDTQQKARRHVREVVFIATGADEVLVKMLQRMRRMVAAGQAEPVVRRASLVRRFALIQYHCNLAKGSTSSMPFISRPACRSRRNSSVPHRGGPGHSPNP